MPVDPKWIRNPSDEQAVRDGCTFDTTRGQRVARFFERFLRHSKGQDFAGKPFRLLDWQLEQVVMPLFSWTRPDGSRRFRRAYIEIPKKNGKSTLGAGLGLYLLVADNEPGAEIYSAAVNREQAAVVHDEAISMVKASPDLSRLLKINHSTRHIRYHELGSFYRALPAEADTAEGLNAHGMLIDELHAWTAKRRFWDTQHYAGASRKQPLRICLTTAGVFDPASVCWEEHEYAEKVRTGVVIDTTYLPVIYAADKDDDWRDEAIWRKANPSYGVTVNIDSMREDCAEAVSKPRSENTFRRYRLNQWVQQSERWLSMEAWDACAQPVLPQQVMGRLCCGALDLASSIDIASFVLAFEALPDGTYPVLAWFWSCTDQALDRERRNRVPYLTWQKQGHMLAAGVGTIDFASIRQSINELGKQYRIKQIAFDPWNATFMAQELTRDGFDMIEFRQNYQNYNEPCREFERLMTDGLIRHGGHPVLRWMAGNIALDTTADGGAIRPSKKRSFEKIDGVCCAIMALSRMRSSERAPGAARSVYETRGLAIG